MTFSSKTIESVMFLYSDLSPKAVEKSNIKETINAVQRKLKSCPEQNVLNTLTPNSFPSVWI